MPGNDARKEKILRLLGAKGGVRNESEGKKIAGLGHSSYDRFQISKGLERRFDQGFTYRRDTKLGDLEIGIFDR